MSSVPSTKEDILCLLLQDGPLSAIALADTLGISPQAIRRHLKDLETEQLIERHKQNGGLGRPQYLYHLSAQGRQHFPQRYGEFAVSFLESLVAMGGEEQLGQVFKHQWQQKAESYRRQIGSGPLLNRVQKLVELRRQEGYMAELHQPTHLTPNTFILAEHHCAIAAVSESFPTVCGHELEMFAAVLPDCAIERTHCQRDGEINCGYVIRPR